MKMYAQYFKKNNKKWTKDKGLITLDKPLFKEIIGSDGVLIIDGRLNINHAIDHAINKAMRLKNICHIQGIKIMRGDFKYSCPVSGMIEINNRPESI